MAASLTDLTPRPAQCYDPRTPPYRDELGVHLFDHATVRAVLRDPRRVTSDVSELLTPALRDRVHPVAAFVWATDRTTLSGRPGRHAALRTLMAPWFTPQAAAARQGGVRARVPTGAFDLFGDYAFPLVVDYLADWLGVEAADVRFAVDDQLAAGEMFAAWPPVAPPGMAEHYRDVMARRDLGGLAAAARELVRSGTLHEREAWGVLYAFSVSAVATATAITLATGLAIEHGLWGRMNAERDAAADVPALVEEAVRLGGPFPQASRFAREPFTVGDVAVEPGDQVLMWLTAANRDLPGPQPSPLDRFDPRRDTSTHVGWGSGYHLCGGVHHARAVAVTAVTALAAAAPELRPAGPWRRFVGVDDGYVAAPVTRSATVDGSPRSA